MVRFGRPGFVQDFPHCVANKSAPDTGLPACAAIIWGPCISSNPWWDKLVVSWRLRWIASGPFQGYKISRPLICLVGFLSYQQMTFPKSCSEPQWEGWRELMCSQWLFPVESARGARRFNLLFSLSGLMLCLNTPCLLSGDVLSLCSHTIGLLQALTHRGLPRDVCTLPKKCKRY